MKKISLLIVVLSITTIANSQITELPNGNVGIGATNPSMKLELGNLGQYDGIKIGSMFKIRTSNTGSNNFVMENIASSGNLYFRSKIDPTYTGDIILNDKGGNIGIGITNPSMKLELGNLGQYDGIKIGSMFKIRTSNTGSNNFVMENIATDGNLYIRSRINANYSGDIILNDAGGNVGIGTTNPGAWKLAVNGQIRAKEIKVETGWSDFVFYDNYKLPTLQEVENHIKDKGHLKDIPSAKEVEQDGILLGEMDSKLLQKIEELTLYTIQQEKDLKSQNIEIEKLKKENGKLTVINKKLLELQSRLEKLESKKQKSL
jgi:hypothetical protein